MGGSQFGVRDEIARFGLCETFGDRGAFRVGDAIEPGASRFDDAREVSQLLLVLFGPVAGLLHEVFEDVRGHGPIIPQRRATASGSRQNKEIAAWPMDGIGIGRKMPC